MAKITMFSGVQNSQPDVIENLYDSPPANLGGKGTEILAFSATNDEESSASYKAYIYDASGNLVKPIVPQKIVVRDRFDLGPSSIGHTIPPGGSLRVESSTALSIAFFGTGNEL